MQRPTISHYLMLARLLAGAGLAMFIGYLFRMDGVDFMQYQSDAAYFFKTASEGGFDVQFNADFLSYENTFPVGVWASIYGFMKGLGIGPNPLWGIFLNALLVVSAQLAALFYAHRVFRYDNRELAALASLMCLNGAMMMFAGIHMRDAFLLLTTTLAVIVFHPRAPGQPPGGGAKKLAWLVLLALVSVLSRTEGGAVPVMVYLIAAFMSMDMSKNSSKLLMVAGFLLIAILFYVTNAAMFVVDNYTAYKLLSLEESGESSLAATLIYKLPVPVSTIMASVLLLIVKVPFYSGTFLDSYNFFMSVSALEMLWVAPAFIAIFWFSVFNRVDAGYKYLLRVVLAMLLVTALTSAQVRHFAVVYPFLLLLFVSRNKIIMGRRRSHYRALQYAFFSLVIILTLFTEFRALG